MAIWEPPVSAIAFADQMGSMYQAASTNGLSKRGPALAALELLTLTAELLATELLITDELLELIELELGRSALLDDSLDDVVATELDETMDDEELVVAAELEVTPQPATTPKGKG